jgi:hypothetical protein
MVVAVQGKSPEAIRSAIGSPSRDDMKVQVSPEAIAKSQGTDLKTAVAGLLAAWTASLKSMPGRSPLAAQVLEGMLDSQQAPLLPSPKECLIMEIL